MKVSSKISSLLLVFVMFIHAYSQQATHSDPYPLHSCIDILHYKFELRLEDSTDNIQGNASITFMVKSPEKKLFLDLVGIDNTGGMKVIQVMMNQQSLKYQHIDNQLIIECPAYHGRDTLMCVQIKYEGIPKDGLIIGETKFAKRSFFGDNWPDRARNWLPCIDHVSDKATLEFVVNTPDHYGVVANGYLFRQFPLPDSRMVSHWKSDVPLPTKVMVIGAADFAVEMAGFAGKTPIQTWVYPDNQDEGFYDYKPAVKVVNFYNDLIGEFAFEKLANVQSKTIYGGMENSGCIFYYENSVTGNGRVESLLAHEIAHQWFGDAVTEKDWHHIWLSEGFATYLEAVYMEAQHGNDYLKNSMERSRNRVIASYQRNPVPVIDTSITNLRRLLSTNSYQKGAWVLHMLRQKLGDEVFWQGMQAYYHQYKNKECIKSRFLKLLWKEPVRFH